MISLEHYYGDTVRRLFIAGAVIMLSTLPFFVHDIGWTPSVPIWGIVIVSAAAGLTSPRFLWSAILNACASLFCFATFEWYAVTRYQINGATPFFWTNQALALIFIFALYYSIKTLRGTPTKIR